MMKDVIGIETIRIGDTEYTDDDLAALPLAKLEELKVKVNSVILEIAGQLRRKETEPVTAESEAWFINARHAQSVNQRFLPYLSHIIKQRKLAFRPLSEYFVDVANEMVEPKDFQQMMAEAQRRKKVADQG